MKLGATSGARYRIKTGIYVRGTTSATKTFTWLIIFNKSPSNLQNNVGIVFPRTTDMLKHYVWNVKVRLKTTRRSYRDDSSIFQQVVFVTWTTELRNRSCCCSPGSVALHTPGNSRFVFTNTAVKHDNFLSKTSVRKIKKTSENVPSSSQKHPDQQLENIQMLSGFVCTNTAGNCPVVSFKIPGLSPLTLLQKVQTSHQKLQVTAVVSRWQMLKHSPEQRSVAVTAPSSAPAHVKLCSYTWNLNLVLLKRR